MVKFRLTVLLIASTGDHLENAVLEYFMKALQSQQSNNVGGFKCY